MLRSYKFMNGILSGFGLGILSREQLHAISEQTYGGLESYRTDQYNRRGLWKWEERALDAHFGGCKRLLVAAAGGGREVLALCHRGLEVDAFEPNPELVRYANELLKREGLSDNIRLAAWDGCPDYDGKYDGVIIGWGAYMHIRGSDARVGLLKQLRELVETGSPILLSFMSVERLPRWMRLASSIGNTLARVSRRDRVEPGDWMEPDYKHYFTREELSRELRGGGFDLVQYDPGVIGSAVGIAVDRRVPA